jgi:type II secretory pathway pseudopilin PulG
MTATATHSPPARALPARRRGRAPAFTLLEILLVVSLLSLMALFAWPRLETRVLSSELPESADRFRSVLAMARAAAVMDHCRYRIRFAPGEQQPYIEYEPDPIRAAGEYFPATAGWAQESPLMGDIEVHEVRPGRPEFLTPVATEPEAEPAPEATEVEGRTEGELMELQQEQEEFTLSTAALGEAEIDEHRPPIVFEPDGSSDWATIILARIPPTEDLAEDDPQKWVLIDGRTGIAVVREVVTEEQVAFGDFTIAREKLLPPQEREEDELTFEIPGPGQALQLGPGAAGPPGGSPPGGQMPPALGDGRLLPGVQPGGETLEGLQPEPPPQPPAEQPADPMADLEEKLKNSNLTEEEKEQVRQAFRDGQKQSGTEQSGTKG